MADSRKETPPGEKWTILGGDYSTLRRCSAVILGAAARAPLGSVVRFSRRREGVSVVGARFAYSLLWTRSVPGFFAGTVRRRAPVCFHIRTGLRCARARSSGRRYYARAV